LAFSLEKILSKCIKTKSLQTKTFPAHQEDKDIVPKGTAFAQSTRPHEDENSVTRRNPRKIRDLRTVFEREPKDLIDARIEKSRQPIPVRDESVSISVELMDFSMYHN
jgi:hypothetical protein